MLCTICLDALQSPVVTPCGHVFCSNCLISSCQKSPDATRAPCPTCRTSFSLVSPNIIFVPEKYRQFMYPSVRRLFLDNSEEQALQERVAQLEARVNSLETQKDLLMNRCESYMAASIRHAENEKEMRARCNLLQNELNLANLSVAELVGRETRRIINYVEQHPGVPPRSVTDNLDPTSSSMLSFGALPKVEKRHSSIPKHMPPDADNRPTVPLPKRRRVTRQGIVVDIDVKEKIGRGCLRTPTQSQAPKSRSS